MARIAKFEPKELPNGKWELNIPAEYSDTGKRRRCMVETKPLAQAEADKIKRDRKLAVLMASLWKSGADDNPLRGCEELVANI